MKIVYICSTLDLDAPFGATPVHWQILKAFHELGNEAIAIPYFGHAQRTLWWRVASNPCEIEANLFIKSRNMFRLFGQAKNVRENKGLMSSILSRGYRHVASKWKKNLDLLLSTETDVSAVVIAGVPLNQFNGVANHVRREHSIPVFYYDMDVPTSLPNGGGFSFSYYNGADISEYDAFIIPSEGSLKPLKEIGVNRIHVMHFGADPDLYSAAPVPKKIDVFFYGTNGYGREEYIESLVTKPSVMSPYAFVVSTRQADYFTGNTRIVPLLSFAGWRMYASASKINLNITRKNHAMTYCTSTSRPFELAAMQGCIVTGPHNGIEQWFSLGSEMYKAESASEAIELYKWLLADQELREEIGFKARQRVLREHTFRHRVSELTKFMSKWTGYSR